MYRPTSRDAIAKMLSGAAVRCPTDLNGSSVKSARARSQVGKGLNVKGKSAKLPGSQKTNLRLMAV